MKKLFTSLALGLTALLSGPVLAHEGHHHSLTLIPTECSAFGVDYECMVTSTSKDDKQIFYALPVGGGPGTKIICDKPRHSGDRKTTGVYVDLRHGDSDRGLPGTCNYNISTLSQRSILFSTPQQTTALYFPFNHPYGR